MELSVRLNPGEGLGDRVLKVNHAGEHGAVNIYAGQIVMARFTAPSRLEILREFLAHEKRHRRIFEKELKRRGLRRCRSYMFCGLGGYILGLITGALGRSSIAATTIAVEKVVLEHLEKQQEALAPTDPEAVSAIEQIIVDEQNHHDSSHTDVERGSIWLKVLVPTVSLATETVIWLGMHL